MEQHNPPTDRSDRRLARRVPTIETARAYVTDGESEPQPLGATITDVSAEGIALTVDGPVQIGSTVLVEWQSAYVPATVRRCVVTEEGCQIGLQLEHVNVAPAIVKELMAAARRKRAKPSGAGL